MRKEDIIARLEKSDSTVLSFPDRGPWGSNTYRGNCSGWYQAFLAWKYNVKYFGELFAGSGTGYDVCKDLEIPYIGADLNPDPVRKGILKVDAFTDEVPDEFYDVDHIFMHPPYSSLIHIPYAGSMYPDPTGELSKADLGQMPWEEFIKKLNAIIMKYYRALSSGGKMSILMGDIRRQGHLYSMLMDIVKPGEVEQIIVKTQHNTVSEKKQYQKKNFVPLTHEYLLVLKKQGLYILNYVYPQKYNLDIRDSKTATWKDVVMAVMKKLGRGTLTDIYKEIEGHKKCETNIHWKEKVRQTLQQCATSPKRGVWAVA